MDEKNKYRIPIALALGGMAVWIVITSATGRREAWDSSYFWSVGAPVMLAMNAAAGFLEPRRLRLKGIISVSLQPAAMMIKTGEIGSMFPLGLLVFLVLGLLCSLGGSAGALVKREFFTKR